MVGSSQAGLEMARSTLEGNRANLENQRANLAKARAVADNDARQAVRMKTLFERGLVSATDWENARTNCGVVAGQCPVRGGPAPASPTSRSSTAESQVRLSQAQLETNRAALMLARTNLANTKLLAPFAGFVAQRNLDPGAAVSAQSAGTNTSSVGILTLHDIETVKVQIEVPERDIARVRVGAPVRLSVDPYQRETFTGSVARVVHNLDPRSRTMGVEVETPNPGGRLKPGMFARVEVLVETRPGALTLPAEALRLGDAKPSVMVVRNGIVEMAPIEVGLSDARGVEVLAGLGDKDQVILQGKDLVKPKQKVRTAAVGEPVAVHVAHPHGPQERDRHPDGVARDRGARRHVAGPDADRPLPQYQLPLDPHRHRLQGRQRPGHRADRHLPHREGGLRRLERAPRGVALPPGHLGGGGLLHLGIGPGCRASPRSSSASSRS